MTDATAEIEPVKPNLAGTVARSQGPFLRGIATGHSGYSKTYRIAIAFLLCALVVIALCTFREYAISNDEGVQHHYGKLIIAYYKSHFADQSVFHFENLYLYGGFFDIIAVALSDFVPIDPYDLRHILCALIGIGGIGTAAATARLIAGPRAGLITAVALAVSGAWYGVMFNHTKDIPFAAAMSGATFFLIRASRNLPRPRVLDLLAFGLLAGAALGTRVLGLLLVIYAGAAIILLTPRPFWGYGRKRWRFVIESSVLFLPALLIAYVIMILAWPWAALAPLNPIRGLLSFSEFQYHIRTILAGYVYEMAGVPRFYVPIYILIRVPLLILLGAGLAMVFSLLPRAATSSVQLRRKEVALVSLTVMFPLACQVILHGPAFSGMRHFLFVLPPLAVLAGIGLDVAVAALAARYRTAASGALAIMTASFLWNAATLIQLHPYEYLFYNPMVGGLEGASRRYDTDYWVNIMPAAVDQLEDYITRTEHSGTRTPHRYTVAVCGERISFEKHSQPRLLQWTEEWDQADFFIAPTHMNCDRSLDGKAIVTIERLGVPIGYVKDRRAITHPDIAATPLN